MDELYVNFSKVRYEKSVVHDILQKQIGICYNFIGIITKEITKNEDKYPKRTLVFFLDDIEKRLRFIQRFMVELSKEQIDNNQLILIEQMFKSLDSIKDIYKNTIISYSFQFGVPYPIDHPHFREILELHIPLSEKYQLLNLAPVIHEISHLLTFFDKIPPVANREYDIPYIDKEELRKEGIDPNEVVGIDIYSWMEEFCCDIIGVYLVGPAYLFSLINMTINLEPFRVFEKHPPNNLRIKLLIDILEKNGYKKYTEEIKKYWDEHIGEFEMSKLYNLLYKKLNKCVYDYAGKILRFLEKNNVRLFDVETYGKCKNYVDSKKKLTHDLGYSFILNSLWIKFKRFDRDYKDLEVIYPADTPIEKYKK